MTALVRRYVTANVRSKLLFRKPQLGLFPGDPLGRLDGERLVGWLKATVARLDMAKVHALFEDHGGVPYDPSRLLCALILGAFNRRTSSRELEDACRFDVRFVAAADFETPDYRTLARFRARLVPVMDDLFAQVVRMAMEDGLVSLGRVSLDSTKVASAGSQGKEWFRKGLDEDAAQGLCRPYSDPEAPVRKTRKGPLRGYTVQAAVDTESGIVVSCGVTLEPNDRGQVPETLERIASATGALPSALLADKGYGSNGSHACLEARGVVGFVPPQDNPSVFWSDLGDGTLRCPMGHPALPMPVKLQHGVPVVPYRVRKCGGCILKQACSPKARGRTVVCAAGLDPLARVRAGRRALEPEGKAAAKERSGSVEPVFGDMKWNHRLSRLTLRTHLKAKAQILLWTTAKNLRTMFKRLAAALTAVFATVFGPEKHGEAAAAAARG